MMKKIVASLFAALSLAFLVTLPVLAQVVQTQTQAARQDEPSPAMTVAVRRMLDAMQYQVLTRQIFDRMLQSVPDLMRQEVLQDSRNDPTLSEEEKARMLARVEKEIPVVISTLTQVLNSQSLIDELGAEMVSLYARYYTVQEIEQLTAFYQTPLGRKMLATMPHLSAESMVISQRVLNPRINAVLEQVQRAARQPSQ